MDAAISDRLARGASDLGVPLDARAVARLLDYLAALEHWSRRVNLTALRTPEEIVDRHLLDSLAAVPILPEAASLVDVGSGAGIPGLPIGIARPGLRVTLVEPRRKRGAFLRHVRARLGLDVEIVEARAESLGRRFDVACSRATFPPADWLAVGRTLADWVAVWTPGGFGVPAARVAEYCLPDGYRGRVELFHVQRM